MSGDCVALTFCSSNILLSHNCLPDIVFRKDWLGTKRWGQELSFDCSRGPCPRLNWQLSSPAPPQQQITMECLNCKGRYLCANVRDNLNTSRKKIPEPRQNNNRERHGIEQMAKRLGCVFILNNSSHAESIISSVLGDQTLARVMRLP